MKKLIALVFFTIFAVCQTYAQIENEATPQDTLNFGPTTTRIVVPVMGKNQFTKHHLIYQELGFSTIAGKDNDRDTDSDSAPKGTDGQSSNLPNLDEQLNLGLNVDYTLKFVPGTIDGDNLVLNRLGFAYSAGIVAAFDRQDDLGITCDFMAKIGIEAGNGHALGVGLDGLIGTGKSSGTFYLEGEDPEGFTEWCLKYGAQFWVKTNLLTTSIPNTDILMFARFIYSKDPLTNIDLGDIYAVWHEEAWTFGITLRYQF